MIDSKTLTNRDLSKIKRHTITTRDQREEKPDLQTSAIPSTPAPEPVNSEKPEEDTENAD